MTRNDKPQPRDRESKRLGGPHLPKCTCKRCVQTRQQAARAMQNTVAAAQKILKQGTADLPIIVRFRFVEQGGHTHVRVYSGKTETGLGKCGDLVFRNEEWKQFATGMAMISNDTVRIQIKREEEETDG